MLHCVKKLSKFICRLPSTICRPVRHSPVQPEKKVELLHTPAEHVRGVLSATLVPVKPVAQVVLAAGVHVAAEAMPAQLVVTV